jgi:hypothetical protein
LYGLPKVHKEGCPVRPILAAHSNPNFNLGKLLVPILSSLSDNDYTLKNSYDFVQSIGRLDNADSYFMCSLDVESLYTNVPVNETIDIILDRIFTNDLILHHGLTRNSLQKLLKLSLNDSFFRFDGCLYQQLDGLAMGSALSPVVANIFLDQFETQHLRNCPPEFKPKFYRRYLDDTFFLFNNEEEALLFFIILTVGMIKLTSRMKKRPTTVSHSLMFWSNA